MFKWDKSRNDIQNIGETAVKVISFHYFIIISAVVQVLVVWLSTKGSLFPGAETIQSIAGTGAEIVAGLYGLTLAGYTFFLSRIDALMATDATLDYVVSSIKARFKHLIWYITLNVLLTLLVSMLLMYCPAPENSDHVFYYQLFCNEFIVFLGFSLVLILYYSILVVDPNCLEKEARRLKNKISSPVGPDGSTAEFIALYDSIEARCNAMIPEKVLSQIHENKGKRFEYTIELLREQKLLPALQIRDLNRIHRYYECVVNCKSLQVTMEMCLTARRLLKYLEEEESGSQTSLKTVIKGLSPQKLPGNPKNGNS